MKRLFLKGLVLEIGSGHRPYPQSDILVDFDLEKDSQRGGKLRVDNRPMVLANLEKLPFKRGVFAYSIASHVLEHVEDVESALSELARVSDGGYIETPSALLELIEPHRDYHLWFVKWEDNRLTLIRKKDAEYIKHSVVATLFSENLAFRLFKATNAHLIVSKIYWKGSVEFEIEDREFNPDEYLQLLPQGILRFMAGFFETLHEVGSRKVAKLLAPAYRLKKYRMQDLLICTICRGDVTVLSDQVVCSDCNGFFPIASNVYYMLDDRFVYHGGDAENVDPVQIPSLDYGIG